MRFENVWGCFGSLQTHWIKLCGFNLKNMDFASQSFIFTIRPKAALFYVHWELSDLVFVRNRNQPVFDLGLV
eukprot:UN21449